MMYIAYDKKLSDGQKNLLKCVLNIPRRALSDTADVIVKQYNADLAARYNMPSDFAYSGLKSISHPSEITSALPIKHIDLVVIYQFSIFTFDAWKRLPYRAMIALYLMEHPVLESEAFLNEIKNLFARLKLDMAFNMSRDMQKQGALFSKLINTAGYSIRPRIFDQLLKKESRENLLNRLKEKIDFMPREKKNFTWHEEEIVRLLAGNLIYENINGAMKSVWRHLQESSLFGFLLTRTDALMRDALTRT